MNKTKNKKIKFTVMVILYSIIYIFMGCLIAFTAIDIYPSINIKSNVVEKVVENNSENIIALLKDEKLNNSYILLNYDDVKVEIIKEDQVIASAYGYDISYTFNQADLKLEKQSVERDLSYDYFYYQFGGLILVLVISYIIIIFLIYSLVLKNNTEKN